MGSRAKGVLTSVHDAPLRCLHAETLFYPGYMKHRGDPRLDIAILQRKYARGQTGDTRLTVGSVTPDQCPACGFLNVGLV